MTVVMIILTTIYKRKEPAIDADIRISVQKAIVVNHTKEENHDEKISDPPVEDESKDNTFFKESEDMTDRQLIIESSSPAPAEENIKNIKNIENIKNIGRVPPNSQVLVNPKHTRVLLSPIKICESPKPRYSECTPDKDQLTATTIYKGDEGHSHFFPPSIIQTNKHHILPLTQLKKDNPNTLEVPPRKLGRPIVLPPLTQTQAIIDLQHTQDPQQDISLAPAKSSRHSLLHVFIVIIYIYIYIEITCFSFSFCSL